MKDYNVVVIGSGGAGLTAAFTAAGLGKKVAIIEKNLPGGECTWSGCIPSKALIHKAKQVHEAKEIASIMKNMNMEIDKELVMTSVRDIIQSVYAEETPEKIKERGIDFYQACAKFVDKNTIKIEEKTITGDKFIIATGTKPIVIDYSMDENIEILTNETIFKMKELPESMAIIGGGPIGIELAQAFNRLGVNVHVLLRRDSILKKEDIHLSKMVKKILESEGVVFENNFNIEKLEKKENKILIHGEHDKKLETETIFSAIGRKVDLKDMFPETMKIKWSKNGIEVNNYMQTAEENIYACGDIVGPYRFSHMAEYQGRIAGQNSSLPKVAWKKCKYDLIPWVTFTDPEFARFGLTESQSQETHHHSHTYTYDYSKLDRAKTEGTEIGQMKIITSGNGEIIGIHILGERSGELLHELMLMKLYGKKLHKLQDMIHAYPTYSDSLRQISKEAYIQKLLNNPIVKLIKKN